MILSSMRDPHYLHAQHIDEAVRQGVISGEQREALFAVARAMAESAREASELLWMRALIAGAVVLAVTLPGLALLTGLPELSHGEVLAAGLVGCCSAGALAALGRARGWAPTVVGTFVAGAVCFAWAIGAGVARTVLYAPQLRGAALHALRELPCWTIPGDIALLIAALAFGVWMRAPVVALPASAAFSHMVVRTGTWLHVSRPAEAGVFTALTPSLELLYFVLASMMLLAVARALDRRVVACADPGFWVHLFALLPALGACMDLGVAHLGLAVRASIGATLLAVAIALGFRWRRPSYLVVAALGALGIALTMVQRNGAPTLALEALMTSAVVAGTVWLAQRYRRSEESTKPSLPVRRRWMAD